MSFPVNWSQVKLGWLVPERECSRPIRFSWHCGRFLLTISVGRGFPISGKLTPTCTLREVPSSRGQCRFKGNRVLKHTLGGRLIFNFAHTKVNGHRETVAQPQWVCWHSHTALHGDTSSLPCDSGECRVEESARICRILIQLKRMFEEH